MDETDRLIDAALDSAPLAPLPPRFVRRTMARILADRRPRFRLEFLDLALPVFFGVFALTLIGVGVWLANGVDPIRLLELQVRLQWYSQNLNFLPIEWFAAAAVAAACVVALGAFVAALALERPVRDVRP